MFSSFLNVLLYYKLWYSLEFHHWSSSFKILCFFLLWIYHFYDFYYLQFGYKCKNVSPAYTSSLSTHRFPLGTFKSNSLSLSFCHSRLIIFCLFPHITINSVTQGTNLGVFHYFYLSLLIQFVNKSYRFYFLSIFVHPSPHSYIKPVTRALFKVHHLLLICFLFSGVFASNPPPLVLST